MSEFIKTSDGKIAVRKSIVNQIGYTDPGFMNRDYELIIYSHATPGGRIYRYGQDKAARDKALKEISEAL